MANLINQDFLPVHTPAQPKPVTIASAATIAPTARFSVVTGTVQIANITPNDPAAYQEVVLNFTNAAPGAFLTNGTAFPITTAYQPIQNRPICLCYNPNTKSWWPMAVV